MPPNELLILICYQECPRKHFSLIIHQSMMTHSISHHLHSYSEYLKSTETPHSSLSNCINYHTDLEHKAIPPPICLSMLSNFNSQIIDPP